MQLNAIVFEAQNWEHIQIQNIFGPYINVRLILQIR